MLDELSCKYHIYSVCVIMFHHFSTPFSQCCLDLHVCVFVWINLVNIKWNEWKLSYYIYIFIYLRVRERERKKGGVVITGWVCEQIEGSFLFNDQSESERVRERVSEWVRAPKPTLSNLADNHLICEYVCVQDNDLKKNATKKKQKQLPTLTCDCLHLWRCVCPCCWSSMPKQNRFLIISAARTVVQVYNLVTVHHHHHASCLWHRHDLIVWFISSLFLSILSVYDFSIMYLCYRWQVRIIQ